MKILVRDRRQGKTTELIKWLLQGREQDVYPYWSRVIVACTHKMMQTTTGMLLHYIERENWNPCEQMLPHMHRDEHRHGGMSDDHVGVLTDVRKAVWGPSDLDRNIQGTRPFEFAIDDADQMFTGFFGFGLARQPAVITMTGEHVDSLCD